MTNKAEMGHGMKFNTILVFVLLGVIPGFAQDKKACQAYFQVVQTVAPSAGSLRVGMDPAQEKWWKKKGQKKYPGFCRNGGAPSGDTPRYLLVWSRSGESESQAAPAQMTSALTDAFGLNAATIRDTTAMPTVRILHRDWKNASISIISVSPLGTAEIPPIYFTVADPYWWWRSDSPRALEEALKFLALKN